MAPLEDRVVVAKQCRRCLETKPANDFYRNKLMADGLYSHCKVPSVPCLPCLGSAWRRPHLAPTAVPKSSKPNHLP